MTKAVLFIGVLVAAGCDVGTVPLNQVGTTPDGGGTTDGTGSNVTGDGGAPGIQPNVCQTRQTTPQAFHPHTAPVNPANPSNAGQHCMQAGCHAVGGAGGEFQFAGTLYQADGVTADPGGAFIEIVANGSTTVNVNSPHTDTAGNFYIGPGEGDPITNAFPAMIYATACPTITPMTQSLVAGQGDCYTCHANPPSGGASGVLTLQ